jgi:hypothetical protein
VIGERGNYSNIMLSAAGCKELTMKSKKMYYNPPNNFQSRRASH